MYTIYSKPNCPYCVQAKQLLSLKNLPYQEFLIDLGYRPRQPDKKYIFLHELKKIIPNVSTVPQILLDGKLIGGFKELKEHFGNT